MPDSAKAPFQITGMLHPGRIGWALTVVPLLLLSLTSCALVDSLRKPAEESEAATAAEPPAASASLQAEVVDPTLPGDPPPSRAAAVPATAPADGRPESEEETARRQLPPGTVILEKEEGFFSRMWHRVFPKRESPPAASKPTWIGTITMVDERDGFALIDSQPFFNLSTGLTLNSVGQDVETGILRVSPDRNPPFFIADIISGRPKRGDRVYSPEL